MNKTLYNTKNRRNMKATHNHLKMNNNTKNAIGKVAYIN